MPITVPTVAQGVAQNAQIYTAGQAAQAAPANAGQAAQAQAANAGQAAQANAATAGQAATSAGSQIDLSKLGSSVGVTAEDRLKGILSEGGALMQQSATMGNQQAASRGLLNSSMGIQAAQNAMIANASPIAQNDAALLTNNNQFNAGQKNQVLTQNAQLGQNNQQFNAGAINQQNQYNASNQQQTNLANQQARNQQNQYNASNQQQTNLANQSATNQQNQQNATWQQQTNLANQQATNQQNQWNANAQNQGSQFNTQQSNAMNQWNAGQRNEAIKQTLDINSREALANIEANYKTLLQTNSSASGMYEQYLKNLSDISQSDKMDATAKQTAMDNQTKYLRSGLNMLQNMNDIQGLVTF